MTTKRTALAVATSAAITAIASQGAGALAAVGGLSSVLLS
jgi:hypothetical protein